MRARRLIRVALSVLVVPVVLLCFSASALAAPEAPVTREAKLITGRTAVLHGVLNPRAKAPEAVEYSFAYAASGSECTGGLVAPVLPVLVPGDPGEAVSETLTGLEGSTTYTFCLVANPVGEPPLSGLPLTFKTLAAAPVVDSVSSSAVTPFEAHLEAMVNPENQATSCVFQYGPTSAYGKEVPCEQGTLGGGEQPVGVTISRLAPDTVLHFRVLLQNATGKTEGADTELTTSALGKPLVEDESSASVTPLEETVSAEVNPDYQTTTCEVEYGPTASYGKHTPCSPASLEGGGLQGISQSLAGLEANKTYHYRVVAVNATGKTEGPDAEFKTSPLEKPTVESENATGVTPFEGTLEAQVDPDYQTTTCEIQYGLTTTSYGPLTPCDPASLEGGPQGISLPVSGLQSETTYHFRVLAKNATGETEGLGQFTTPNAQPLIETESAAFITSTSATLQAQINPNYREATYLFEYATEESVLLEGNGTKVPGGTLPVGNSGQIVRTQINALTPGTKYYYRAVATNTVGTTNGMPVVQSFKTPTPPVVITGAAEFITSGTATATGTVNPEGLETHYTIQYGPTTSYGQNTTSTLAGAETTPVQTGPIHLNTLTPGTTYHYRLVAINTLGETTAGADMQFTTAPAPPSQPPLEGGSETPPAGTATASPPAATFPNLTTIAPVPTTKEPGETTPSEPKSLTRAQKLAKALKACKRSKGAKRTKCEKQAHARYGKTTKKKGR